MDMHSMDNQGQTPQKQDLRPEWGIFIPALLAILLVSIPSFLYPKAAEEIVGAIYYPFAANFGTLYLWLTLLLIVLCGYFAFSKWGDIKFGAPDEKPEFSLPSWIGMIFCSTVAGAVMFWAIVEPLWDLVLPPQGAAPMSIEAYDWSLAYLLLHWGPNAWCSYFICALPIAYMLHIKKKPFLRISTASTAIIGKAHGIIGRCIDIFFILGLLFCTAVTMCLSLPTIVAALKYVFGITPSFTVDVTVLLISSLLAAVTVFCGLKKGIKILSDINILIALGMVIFGFIAGPSSTLFDIFTNALGKMLGNYMNMTFWTDPFGGNTFPKDWTVFYALFWAGFGPYIGMFIARISRGRTIREVIVWGMLGSIAGSYLIHGVFGSYSLWVQSSGLVDVVSILQNEGAPMAMMAVLDTLPCSSIVLVVYCFFSTIFLATSMNAGCYVVASTATRVLPEGGDPHRLHSTFWAGVQGLLALGLLSVGGLGFAKIFGNFSGALMSLPILMLVICWFRALREDGDYMLKHHVQRDK